MKVKILVCTALLLIVGIFAYKIIAPTTKTDEVQETPTLSSEEEAAIRRFEALTKTDNQLLNSIIEEEPEASSEQQAQDVEKIEESEAVLEQQAPDVDKIEEPKVNPGAGKDIITYEPPENLEGFWIEPDTNNTNDGGVIIYDPPGRKTRHPVSGMFFIKDGKVDPTADPDDYPYGLKVYSDIMIATNPGIQYVTLYYFKTKKERSEFRPEQHEW